MLRWKTCLYWVHRWLGIGMCLLILLWFASGIIMMYVEYPELTHEEFLTRQPALMVDEVRLNPLQAAQQLGPVSGYTGVSLATSLGRPAYQFESPTGRMQTVFADDGGLLSGLDETQAIAAALGSGFAAGTSGATHQHLVDMDQWTVTASLNPFRPLHRVALHDEAGTQLYVSDVTGQVVRDSDRRERFWNWLGSTVHWIYPVQLRRHSELWGQVIIWLSLIGLVSILTGVWIGIMRLGLRRRYSGNRISPYQGFMKWHHVLGLGSAIFVFTFMFSGLMSMGPWGIFDSATSAAPQLMRYHGQDVMRLASLPPPASVGTADEAIKQVTWHYTAGVPYSVATLASGQQLVNFGDGVTGQARAQTRLLGLIAESVPRLLPEVRLIDLTMLTEYDDYYYSRHNRHRPLPVYRARFDDGESTWYHIDLNSGTVVNRLTDRGRLERWLFYGLHSLDFMLLWRQRPLWDIVVIFLSVIGVVFSLTSVVIGWRRLTARSGTTRDWAKQ